MKFGSFFYYFSIINALSFHKDDVRDDGWHTREYSWGRPHEYFGPNTCNSVYALQFYEK